MNEKQFRLGDQLTAGGEKVRVDEIGDSTITGVLYHDDGVREAGEFSWYADGMPYKGGAKYYLVPINSLDDFRAQWQDKTRGGVEYRIYATDAGGEYPIHGAILTDDGRWGQQTWTANGKYRIDLGEHNYDLLPVEKRDFVMFRGADGRVYTSENRHTEAEWRKEWEGIGLSFFCFLSDFEEWLKTREEK